MRHALIMTLMLTSALAGVLNGVRSYLLKKHDAQARIEALRPPEPERRPNEVIIPSFDPVEEPLLPPPPPETGDEPDPVYARYLTLRDAQELVSRGALDSAAVLLTAPEPVPEFARTLAKIDLFQTLTGDVQPHEFWDGSGLTRVELADGQRLDVRIIRELEDGWLVRLGNGSQMFVEQASLVARAELPPETYRAELRASFEERFEEAGGSLSLYRVARFAAAHRLLPEMIRALEAALGKGEALVLFEVRGDVALRDLWCEAYNVRLVIETIAPPSTPVVGTAPPPDAWDSTEALRLYQLGLAQYRDAFKGEVRGDLTQAEATLRAAKRMANMRLDEYEDDPEASQLASQINELLLDILKMSEMR